MITGPAGRRSAGPSFFGYSRVVRIVPVMAMLVLTTGACGGGSIVGEFAGGIDGRTERFTMVIASVDESGAARGTVRIGAPPSGGFPAPRAEVGYPEGATADELRVLVDNGVAGFEHPMRSAHLVERTLTVPISFVDFWADWCGILDGDPAAGRSWRITASGCSIEGQPADCGKLVLLEQIGVCFCTPGACDVASNLSRATLTLTVDDNDHLSGTFSRASGTLRLTRMGPP